MLSDALKENVVFLNNEMGSQIENTFGANIYDLFRDGMFLDDNYLGITGTYALNKINGIVDRLQKWETLLPTADGINPYYFR